MKVFVAGSRRLPFLAQEVKDAILHHIDRQDDFVVGDANGADKAVQQFLARLGVQNASVYCTGHNCRNNLGRWPIVEIEPPKRKQKDHRFYSAKDRAMAETADQGIMIWDAVSIGTLANVVRLVDREKVVLVFSPAEPEGRWLRSTEEWLSFRNSIEPIVLSDLDSRIHEERKSDSSKILARQPIDAEEMLFPGVDSRPTRRRRQVRRKAS